MAAPPSLDAYVEAAACPLISLVGLAHLHGALSQRARSAAEEPAPRYLSFATDAGYVEHQPPPSGAHPELVLKHGWLHKRLHVSSAVAVRWCTWDASTSPTAIAAQLDALRRSRRRSSRVLLVLVQAPGQAAQPPPGAEERLSALRRAIDLDPRSTIMVETDDTGQTINAESAARVERTAVEAALAHYRDEVRRPRKPKGLPLQRVARQLFKRAFYSELARDNSGAEKFWQQTYAALRELLRAIGANR
jgi:hypothetical protein